MKLKKAVPDGFRRGTAFVSRERGCSMEEVRVPVYHVSLEACLLVELRKARGLGLHVAANKLGIRAVELSGLEHGRLVPEEPSAWKRMIEKIGGFE